MLKVGNSIWIAAVLYLMRIRLTSPIRFRMNGRMNRLFNLTLSNEFDQFLDSP